MDDDTIDAGQLGEPGAVLGSGAQAQVLDLPGFRLPDVDGPLVYKRYHAGQAPVAGVRAVVAMRRRLSAAQRVRLDAIAVWPARTVTSGGVPTGLVLPRIPESYLADVTLPSGRAARLPREIQHLIVAPERAKRIGLGSPTPAQRAGVCAAAAAAIALLHDDLDAVYGDLSARNVLYRLEPAPAVILVDCDAVRSSGSGGAVRQLDAPDWDPPEGGPLTRGTDLYKLGLLVLRCLVPGPGASVGRDPSAAVGQLDPDGLTLLVRALGSLAVTRPSAAEWTRYLTALAAARTADEFPEPPPGPAAATSSAGRAGMSSGAENTTTEETARPDPDAVSDRLEGPLPDVPGPAPQDPSPRRRRSVLLSVAGVALVAAVSLSVGLSLRPASTPTAAGVPLTSAPETTPDAPPTVTRTSSSTPTTTAPRPTTSSRSTGSGTTTGSTSTRAPRTAAEDYLLDRISGAGVDRGGCVADRLVLDAIAGLTAALRCTADGPSLDERVAFFQFDGATSAETFLQGKYDRVGTSGDCSAGQERTGSWRPGQGQDAKGPSVCVYEDIRGTTHFNITWGYAGTGVVMLVWDTDPAAAYDWWSRRGSALTVGS